MGLFCHLQKLKQKEQIHNPAKQNKLYCFDFSVFPLRLVDVQILDQPLKSHKTFGKLIS
jgi:hypothetical protein